MKKVIVSWSGGKDSCLACYKAVIDGPIFKQRIDIIKSRKILREDYWFLDIQEYQLV